jgi:RNA polymerase sigma-70 factor (ECF subfamily)
MTAKTQSSGTGQSQRGAPDNPRAFADWLAPHTDRMSQLAARMAPEADRNDVVQDAMLAAWQSRTSFDPDVGTPLTWLLAITANAARRARRRRRTIPLSEVDRAEVQRTDESIDVEAAVRSLSKRQQMAVNCFYFLGLSIAETASVMGCSEGTVKTQLSRARAHLRPLLETTS